MGRLCRSTASASRFINCANQVARVPRSVCANHRLDTGGAERRQTRGIDCAENTDSPTVSLHFPYSYGQCRDYLRSRSVGLEGIGVHDLAGGVFPQGIQNEVHVTVGERPGRTGTREVCAEEERAGVGVP